MLTFQDLGYNSVLEQYKIDQGLEEFLVGRITSEHKERYTLKTPEQEYEAELIGNLRFTAESRYDFPAVGDWVAFSEYDESKALIHTIYPRKSILERKAAGKTSSIQIIGANIDFGLIVQAVDQNFNINRVERYLTICNSAKVEPIIVLSKVDLLSETEKESILKQINERISDIEIVLVSNQIENGYSSVQQLIEKGKTYCLLGSSGVGKSTLINHLSGKALMDTGHISESVNKGRHITSHRELFVLDNGGILIDNPGMREVGISDLSDGLEITFESILSYAENCQFTDCTHIHENGCAVIEALNNDEIDADSYDNFLRLEREKQHFESSQVERKKKDKDFGKMVKNVKKLRKNNKF